MQNTTEINHVVMTVTWFIIGPVHPIYDVESTIRPHKEDIVSGQVLHLTITLKDNKLRHNRYGLEPYAKSPQKLLQICKRRKTVPSKKVCNESKYRTRSHGKFPMTKCVLRLIVGRTDWFLKANGIHNARSGRDVQNFHYRVVQAVVSCEEIGVASEKDKEEEFVSAKTNALGVAGDA